MANKISNDANPSYGSMFYLSVMSGDKESEKLDGFYYDSYKELDSAYKKLEGIDSASFILWFRDSLRFYSKDKDNLTFRMHGLYHYRYIFEVMKCGQSLESSGENSIRLDSCWYLIAMP